QVLSVPEYTTVTVNHVGASIGRIQATPWNGSCGGIVAFLAAGAGAGDGTVDVSAQGNRGGNARTGIEASAPPGGSNPDHLAPRAGDKGEGTATYYAGPNVSKGSGFANAVNGGGGGNCSRAGGGGGSNAGQGGPGGNSTDGARAVGGVGGAALTFSPFDRMV